MILFLKDWYENPQAIADFETRNTSFINLAALYKAMGVRNHVFLLALHDKTLQGVDPFDYDNLTPDLITRITTECYENPWYFIREIIRVPGGSGDNAIYLEANRGNIALFWYFFNHVTVYLIQVRQTGKTLASNILDVYLSNTRCADTTINLYTKDDLLRSETIEKIKSLFNELPWYINQRTKKDLDNTEVINVSSLRNWIRTLLPQKSPKLALNVGRGSTAAVFKSDEAPFCPNSRISIPAALAAGVNARDRARKNDEPYGSIFTTTAGKKDDLDGRFFYLELQSAAVHSEMFYDCENPQVLEKTVTQASRTNTRLAKKDDYAGGDYAVNITLNHRQLGKDDAWLIRSIKETKVTGDDANRDFFNVWTSGGIRSPFSPQDADKMRASEIDPMYVQRDIKTNYIIRWYIPKDKIDELFKLHKVIIGVDTSDASAGDDIGISGYLDKTGQTIFSCNINMTNLLVFFDWFANEWIVNRQNTVIIIERKSSGIALIDYLLEVLPNYNVDPFKRLFNRIVNDKDQYKDEFDEISVPMSRRDKSIYSRLKRHFGFATSSSGLTSRSDLYSKTLASAVNLVGDVLYDKTLIDQILGLVQKDSRVDHASGEHDDLVISWLLSHFFMTQAKNLYFYDINMLDIFSLIRIKDNLTKEERYQANSQTMIKATISKLVDELSNENDPYLIERKENQIRMLQSQITEDAGDVFSIDELIEKAKQARRQRVAKNSYNNTGYSYNDVYANNRQLDYSDKYSNYQSTFFT